MSSDDENPLIILKKQLVRSCFQKGLLLKPDALHSLTTSAQIGQLLSLVSSQDATQELLDDTIIGLTGGSGQIDTTERTISETGSVEVVYSFSKDSKKREVKDFVAYFNSRHATLSKLLRARPELQSSVSIGRLRGKAERDAVSIIGMVLEKKETKNHNILLTLEDPTGKTLVLVSKSDSDLLEMAKDLVLDEVIGITGTMGKSMVYTNSIIWPDVPLTKELKKAPEESYAIFLSDIHVGSNNFLKEPFERFIRWLNGEIGNEEQKRIVSKIRYVFIVGDMVDGVGIFPGQQEELVIEDITQQYEEFSRYVKRFPQHLSVIICPGNHDAIRLAEPQPPLYEDISKSLYDLENVTMVSNPSMINIGKATGFPGIDVLMYHGYSFDYYVAEVDHIRNQGGYDRADLVMKFLLRRRHLAPTHTSTVYVPVSPDPLLITAVPDIFVSGHIHKAAASQYRNVTLLSGSCWQATTAFQNKVGHHPEPGRVPLVNLQTRKVKLLRFMDDEVSDTG